MFIVGKGYNGKCYILLLRIYESFFNVFFIFRVFKGVYVDIWLFYDIKRDYNLVIKYCINVVFKFFYNGNLNFFLVLKVLYKELWYLILGNFN